MMFLILQTVASKNENNEYDVSNPPKKKQVKAKTMNMMFLILEAVASKTENNEYDADLPNCSK